MLAWHVDYWDRLGWKDPFGSSKFSKRQRKYGKKLAIRIGTPQLFVANAPASRRTFDEAVARAAKQAPPLLIAVDAARKEDTIAVTIKLARPPGVDIPLPKSVHVLPVLFQRRVETQCTAGENKGKKLVEYYVVRKALLPHAANLALQKPIETSFAAPKGVDASNLGVAVLVEDRVKMQTLACRAVPVKGG